MSERLEPRAPLRPRIEPRMLRRDDAADYVALSSTKFDQLVAEGRMPKPLRIDGSVRWDRRKLDAALDAMSDQSPDGDWDFAP